MLSISADKTILTDKTATAFVRARDEMGICGFGEFATRLLSNGKLSDAASISDPRRMKIYDAAEKHGTPINMHVSLAEPDTVAAYERIVAARPHVPFILNHGGLTAGPELLGRLLATYPNVYVELSGRLTPPGPQQARPQSALAADGALKPEWRALFERFPERFMFGMDVQSVESVQGIANRLNIARAAFAPLPQALEENIAYRNISRVMKGCSGLPIG
jgi:predicted TIM-barrel fold metal-dependent hydrolase